MTAIQPELWVEHAADAIAFYQAAFGAVVVYREVVPRSVELRWRSS
jgi:uncharacterized glyoxalase superfamily protein PhnB